MHKRGHCALGSILRQAKKPRVSLAVTNLLLLKQGLSHGREAGKSMSVPAKRSLFASNWPLFSNAATVNGRCVELGLPAVF